MAQTVHVTSPVAGFGNRLDLELVCSLLDENGFAVTGWPAVDRSKKARLTRTTQRLFSLKGRYDINLFLAPLFPEWLPLAKTNILMPNVEGFAQASWLKHIDLVMAKTQLTKRIFEGLGCRAEFTSFTSPDQLDESVPRKPYSFFHSCSSIYKGTQRTLETWKQHPEWPMLTAVVNNHDEIPVDLFDAPNLNVIRHPLEREELQRLQNAHTFHLCCSEAEGFGHYIMEAMSCRAIPLTSDGPPMNELVQPDRGLLVACEDERPAIRLSQRHLITQAGLAEQVECALNLDAAECERMGQTGRGFYLENDALFRRRFIEVMKSL